MTERYELIGYPLVDSLYQIIHKRLFELAGVEAEYGLRELAPENLKDSFDSLKKLNGFTIASPHRAPIIEMCDWISETAQRHGCVNCIKTENGKSIGYNTEAFALVKSVENMKGNSSSDVCLLGCGNMGRMAAIEAAFLASRLTIAVREEDIPAANRIKAEVEELSAKCRVEVIRLDQVKGGYDLLINSTPVGMYPSPWLSPLKKEQLEGVKFLLDAVYRPAETALVRDAKELGITTATGMSLLVLQAVGSHEVWNHSKYDDADIELLIAEMEASV